MFNSLLKNKAVRFLLLIFVSSGLSLIIYVLSGISLLATLIFLILLGFTGYKLTVKKESTRTIMKTVLKRGIPIGLVSTFLVYDLSRFVLIKLTGIQFWPFDIFEIFGKSLLPMVESMTLLTIAGVLFHGINGVFFAIAYLLIFRKYSIFTGVLWAFFLEFLMVMVYPYWLDIDPSKMGEFLSVSVIGHILYGIALGYLSKRFVKLPESKTT